MDIYDRTLWPAVDQNPLILLLARGDDWYPNVEVVKALGLSESRALLSKGTIFSRQIRDDDKAVGKRIGTDVGSDISTANRGGTQRLLSRRAVVMAAMRTDTVNAAAARDWIASFVADGVKAGMGGRE